jgi:uncharacterized protein YeaO (DUF488 family)
VSVLPDVYTGRIGYKGTDGLDITVKSGDPCFAPSWSIVSNIKACNITEEEYTREYYRLMRISYVKNRARWNEALAMPRVTLLCYCRKGVFCHRKLLADILVKLGAEYKGEI